MLGNYKNFLQLNLYITQFQLMSLKEDLKSYVVIHIGGRSLTLY